MSASASARQQALRPVRHSSLGSSNALLKDLRSVPAGRRIDTSATVFGRTVSLPVITAPMGGMWRWCDGGAVACAHACATSGMVTCLSSLADGQSPRPSCSLEGVAAAVPDAAKIFQLYVRGDDA
jgi:isopentenyl diphosphate isomerase/L-lactate dehydrogenase-like FMN-dependent dehydrogenase